MITRHIPLSCDQTEAKMGKTGVPVGRKRLTSSGSGSTDVTILQVPQVMSRNYVRVPAHLRQKPPKKLAPAASSPFKVRRSNRCSKRVTESAFIKVWAIFPAFLEYSRGGKGKKGQGTIFLAARANFSEVRERTSSDIRSRWTLSLSSHRKVVEARGERKWPTRVCRFWDSPWRSWA